VAKGVHAWRVIEVPDPLDFTIPPAGDQVDCNGGRRLDMVRAERYRVVCDPV
jgi:hypothetical protein